MRARSVTARSVFASAMLALCAISASAQLPAAIAGSVIDEKGKGLAGVVVVATSTTSSDVQRVVTSSRGGFRMSGLPPGVYRVEFELAGYKRHVRTGIVLDVGFTANLNNLRLESAAPADAAAPPPPPAPVKAADPAPATAAPVAAAPIAEAIQARAENVTSSMDGSDVTVRFDLMAPPSTAALAILLVVSLDSGTTFDFLPKSVSGDIGDRVTVGAGKSIRWKAARDVERGDLTTLRFRVVVE